MTGMLPARFWNKVEVDDANGCWLWTAVRNNKGYGRFSVNGRLRLAHRLTWAMFHGWPTDSLDHLCRVRHCVNPIHLEQVPIAENILRGTGWAAHNKRKTHCLRGHELSGNNVYTGAGARACRACQRLHSAEWRKRHPEQRAEIVRRNNTRRREEVRA